MHNALAMLSKPRPARHKTDSEAQQSPSAKAFARPQKRLERNKKSRDGHRPAYSFALLLIVGII